MSYEYTRDTYLFDDVVALCGPITETNEYGIVKSIGYKKREVYCRVSSLFSKEFYDAYQSGIQPSVKIIINYEDWREGKEMIVEYDGQVMQVYRTFRKEDEIELYCRSDIGQWQGSMKVTP